MPFHVDTCRPRQSLPLGRYPVDNCTSDLGTMLLEHGGILHGVGGELGICNATAGAKYTYIHVCQRRCLDGVLTPSKILVLETLKSFIMFLLSVPRTSGVRS